MSRTNPLSAAFWADADPKEPGSYSSLEARRRIAEQLAKKSPFPTTLGQGLTYLGESLVERARMNELADAERASDAYADKRLGEIRNTPGGYVPPAEGTATAPVARDAYAQADNDQTENALPPPRRPVGGEETGLPMPAAAPDMPNALMAALRTAPQRNQPGAPSTWGSGKLQQVPTNLADVSPGTFGMRDPAAQGTVSVGRGDEMTVQPVPQGASSLTTPLPFTEDMRNRLAGATLAQQAPMPYLTEQQRRAIGTTPLPWQPRPFEQAPDAAPAPETTQAATAGPLLADRETDADVRTPPIRLASLGGVPAPNTAAVAADNPAIATDIAPMPRQAAADLPPSATGPAVPSSRIAQAPETAPGIPPSRLPIPPDVPLEMKRPGPEPVQPRPLGPSQVQQKMESLFNDRRLAPDVREAARHRYNAEEGYRKELEAARNNKYTNDRAQWNQDVRAYEKFQTEAPVRAIDQRIKLLTIQKAAADEERRPQDAEKLRLEIANAELARQKTLQELARGQAPHKEKFDGADRIWDPVSNSYVKPTMTAIEPGEIEMTEKQSNTVKFLQRATFASQHLAKNDEVLARFWETAAGNVPVAGRAIGNYFRTPEYQAVKAMQMNWGHAVLRDESGALIGEDELRKKLDNYFPIPGDKPDAIAFKAQARKWEEDSLARSLGKARPVYDQFLKERAARKVENPEKYTQGKRYKDPDTGKTHIFLNGYMEDAP